MLLSEFKAGDFERQYAYRSFLPARIHHRWEISDPEIPELLSRADRAIGALDAYAKLVPNIDFFIKMYVLKEAQKSNLIEGIQTHMEDAFKDGRDLDPETHDDVLEVLNYVEALNFAIDRLKTLPLSNRFLRETHRVLLNSVRGAQKHPGAFRTSQNWIGVSLKNAVFIPPHPDRVPDLMQDLELFLHDQDHRVPPLIKISIAHYQFETIHPFLDGNGRLGRLLVPLFLVSEGLLSKPALYLSDYLERNKTAYVDALMAVRHGNHMRNWLIFFLEGLRETARDAVRVLESVIVLKRQVDTEILPRFSVRRQENAQNLMQYLYQKPVVTTREVAILTQSAYRTAHALVSDFVKNGILRPMGGRKRDRHYVFADYIKLFMD